ncbi:MAG TPA: hypothetical protein DEB38_02365 [Acidimicrobiaceae bacterium]|nr:hypothetical protein [Acidimicrobiaceae bacterium]|tara:strand:- start:141 stop:557 length:417 start_codon:yes stop_codon:yes gene_type:complete
MKNRTLGFLLFRFFEGFDVFSIAPIRSTRQPPHLYGEEVSNLPQPSFRPRELSALPPQTARAIAFAMTVIVGVLGAILGYALGNATCIDDCSLKAGSFLLIGAIAGALGSAVMSVLALRAMGEWDEIRDRERAGHAPQ